MYENVSCLIIPGESRIAKALLTWSSLILSKLFNLIYPELDEPEDIVGCGITCATHYLMPFGLTCHLDHVIPGSLPY